jgi:oligopeptide/dipeptide ABC transporter ATP-binding protein
MTAGPLVETVGLEKRFPLTRTASEYFHGQAGRGIHAVDGVSLTILPGETLGLIGESGSGKTTLGWLVARLHDATGGAYRFADEEILTERQRKEILRTRAKAIRENRPILRENRKRARRNLQLEHAMRNGSGPAPNPEAGANADPRAPLDMLPVKPVPPAPPRPRVAAQRLRRWRRNVQIVFQDPVGSLDPRLKVWQIVSEPLRAQGENDRKKLRERVRALLPTVGLPPDCLDQYPHEFSGGGRQRISLARAFSVDPKLVILDEPTSALDVAVQAQILNRLVEFQRERSVAYLLITHNVAAVRYVADRVAVMYLGRIVELGSVRGVLERPVHPYTKALLAAVPVADARRRRARFRIGGDVPSLIDLPPGCRFAPRCPFVVDRCRTEYPALREIPGLPGQLIACHRAEEVRDVAPETLLTSEKPAPGVPPAP